ncbi:MAG: Queuine tRNA-ribosyltransferase [Parcubacteria group bacterium GW2011_GWA2_53_21]|nr:MAG: Queuine tRNA-ribosyltransferase [Parcubacteria group bacterium GW2011_GWA2_53_21]
MFGRAGNQGERSHALECRDHRIGRRGRYFTVTRGNLAHREGKNKNQKQEKVRQEPSFFIYGDFAIVSADMFELKRQEGHRRWGTLTTAHGKIETPFFMPIATKGAVKTLSSADMRELRAQILLSNTYHLLLRPGLEEMKRLGGLHKLMGWDGPILTDSGGYQVFSLSGAKLSARGGSAFGGNKTSEDGVEFQSHIDGARLKLTPELSMEMQSAIGSDIMMQFDDVAAGDSSYERYEEAMERSLRWAKRCKEGKTGQSKLFGIVQGGTYEDLRERSASGLVDIGFDGYAIGGLSVGESREDAYRIVKNLAPSLPGDKPRYFMGGGMPEEIVYYVHQGVDMFDCVLPTRNARHGTLFVWSEDPNLISWDENKADFYSKLHITNETHAFDSSPVDAFCDCMTCKTTSRAYLRHLFSVGEMLALRLATIHNLSFYLRLMLELRK